MANMPYLWKEHTHRLGENEGVGDVIEVLESVAKYSLLLEEERKKDSEGEGRQEKGDVLVDWKKAYRELKKVVSRMKKLVIKRAVTIREEIFLKRVESAAYKGNIQPKFNLQEMLLICESSQQIQALMYIIIIISKSEY